MRTLDPHPSLISAPQARSKLSISAHGIFARTGFSKMACSVLRCLAVIMHYLLHVCRTPMFQQRELVFSSAPLAPNATLQARLKAGARYERTL
jgi:hypothetical protein